MKRNLKPLDFSQCNFCGSVDEPLSDYYGSALCDECIEFEETADIEGYEEEKRRKIAERNEY